MAYTPSTPFDSIESARDYIALLCESLDEAEHAIEREIAEPGALTRPRHLDALRLVDYKLNTLRHHLVASRRLLTDLRALRRYLLDERTLARASGRPPSSDSTFFDHSNRLHREQTSGQRGA